jgi:hypothetical protein
MSRTVIEAPDGSRVMVTNSMADVYDAFLACVKKRPDATFHEVFEMLQAQKGRALQVHVYSGRMSELVRAGLLEKCEERRDDVHTIAVRAHHGQAARATAWRLASSSSQLRLAA